ncbi:MAG: type IV pilus biogenesis/stability protein PilW [Candidatus Competibacteraceae bacterium]
MRSLTQITAWSLALWLAACANTEKATSEGVAEANFKLGIGYMQSGHLDVALEKLNKALQHNDNYPDAHNAIAVLYEEIREYGPAETHFKRALELKSDFTLAKLNYARFLCARDPARIPEGEGEFQKIAADPANAGATAADAYTGLAICANKRADSAQAEVYLRKALESNPNATGALYEMATLSQQQGKTLPARAFLQRYHAQTPPTPQSLWLGVEIEKAKDGNSQMRHEYSQFLLSKFPNSDEARRLK